MNEYMKKWKQSEEYNPVRESAQKSVRELRIEPKWRGKFQVKKRAKVKKKVKCEEESPSEHKNASEGERLSEE